MPAELAIRNSDLICVFGNILNNAEEVCKEFENPEIILKCMWKKPYLSIRCTNPATAAAGQPKQRRIANLERGLGFTILQNFADPYDGQFDAEQEGDTFVTRIMLKGE